ncbi:MAG: amidohydrolase family protein, partial [Egibacteraceae bacterium]
MIIDCHGHYTTAPAQHQRFRDAQLARLSDSSLSEPRPAEISDDEIRESIETNQLARLRERGVDVTTFSPKASGMEHHVADGATSEAWARACNDLIHRVTQLFPAQFVGVCQLPQSLDAPIETALDELTRCVEELGFVGLNLNPDPSGGYWT